MGSITDTLNQKGEYAYAKDFECGSFSRVDPFITHISKSAVHVEDNHILTGIPERFDSHEALHYACLLRPI
jgi:hypothetical protein